MGIDRINPVGGQSISLTGDWGKAKAFCYDATKRSRKALDKAVRDEAMHFANRAKKIITKSGGDVKWPKLSTLTIALRRGAEAAPAHLGRTGRGRKPLVKTGDLRRSIGVEKAGWANYFAGIHRANPMHNIGAIHELGPTKITVTDKMRRFFLYLYVKGVTKHPVPFKQGSEIIIEQRSFLEAAMVKFKRRYKDRLITRWYQYFAFGKSMSVAAR